MLFLEVKNNFTDILKACKNILEFTAVFFAKLVDEFCSNYSFYYNRLFRKLTACLFTRENVIGEHYTVLVT